MSQSAGPLRLDEPPSWLTVDESILFYYNLRQLKNIIVYSLLKHNKHNLCDLFFIFLMLRSEVPTGFFFLILYCHDLFYCPHSCHFILSLCVFCWITNCCYKHYITQRPKMQQVHSTINNEITKLKRGPDKT